VGIVGRLYLDNYTGSTQVKHFVTFGTPYRGSMSTFLTLDQGWGFWINLDAHGLGAIRITALSFPSVYELLPNYPKPTCCFWRKADSTLTYFNPVDPSNWERFPFLPQNYKISPRREWLARTLATAAKIQAEMAVPLAKPTKQIAIASGIIRSPADASPTSS
jgi:hypothetical protein